MNLNDIRRLSANVMKNTDRHPTWATVGELADAIDNLLAVIDALRRCDHGVTWTAHSDRIKAFVPPCTEPATKNAKIKSAGSPSGYQIWYACDKHGALTGIKWLELPYAAALRSLSYSWE